MFSNYSSSTFTLLSHSLLPICKTIILNIVLFGEKKREGVFFVFLFSILITIYLVSASCKSYIGSHMEKSTNGKLSEEEVTVHGVEEFKPDGIIHVEETTPGDGHSSSSSSDEESPVLPVDDEKEEFDSVEPPLVPLSQEFTPDGELVVENMDVSDDVTELDNKEIKEQTLPSLDGDNGFVSSAVVSEETLEKFLSGSNGNIGESSDDVVKLASVENVETKLQKLDDENIENSSKVADFESKENVEKPADVPSVVTDKVGERSVEAEIPGSQINQPIISLASRTRHMTSWRNCCGLFDFLRRSDR